jgi:hypothetical protein
MNLIAARIVGLLRTGEWCARGTIFFTSGGGIMVFSRENAGVIFYFSREGGCARKVLGTLPFGSRLNFCELVFGGGVGLVGVGVAGGSDAS